MEEGCPIYFYLGPFIWGCLNDENNMKPHSRLKDIHFFFFFLCGDQNLLWHNYIKNEKENYSKKWTELAAKADIFGRSK